MNQFDCAKPGNLFAGYERERKKILSGFRNGNSYALIGGRRCGKTSFLIRLEKDLLEKGLLPFYPLPRHFSMGEREGMPSPYSLFQKIYELTVRDLDPPIPWTHGEPEKAYERFLENMRRASARMSESYGRDWLVILLVDEMDSAAKNLPSMFFRNLRHLLMMSRFQKHFRIVATGTGDMARLISSDASPLNNLRGKNFRIMTGEEAGELVEKGVSNPNKSALWPLFDLTGRHPHVLQGVLERMPADSSGWSGKTIRAAARNFLGEHNTFQEWLDGFNETEKVVYHCLTADKRPRMTINQIKYKLDESFREGLHEAIFVLRYHGVIDVVSKKNVKITGTLFRDWFLKNYSAPPPLPKKDEKDEKDEKPLSRKIRVYICAVRRDDEIAQKLHGDLKKTDDIKPWLDFQDLLARQNDKGKIRDQIRKSDYFLALVSKGFSEDKFAKKEIEIALKRKMPGNRAFVIPVRLEDCGISDRRLRNLTRVDLFDSYEKGFYKILGALKQANKQ